MKRAFITGVTGQDGHYLSSFLLSKGYDVHGYVRRNETAPDRVVAHVGDLLDPAALRRALIDSWPDEVYNLGAQSHVGASFLDPHYSMRVCYEPLLTILEQLRQSKRDCRIYQASSSEMFGNAPAPQNELTPFCPRSPYAIAKVAAHNLVKIYREGGYNMFAVGGILFNHESPLRPTAFVTRKITQGAAKIAKGQAKFLELGNLDAKRDWGFAGDYVKAMWLMLQSEKPVDYVISTGETHSVRDFVQCSFETAAEITGFDELRDWERFVKVDERHMRPAEVPELLGDNKLAQTQLGWRPEVGFSGLIRMMVKADLDLKGCER